MSQLFGFSLDRKKKAPKGPSFVQKDNLDGSQPVAGGGHYGYSIDFDGQVRNCLLYTSPSPRDRTRSRMPSSA